MPISRFRPPTAMWTRLRVGVAVVAVALIAACGDDGGTREGAQPASDVTTFEQGQFDELPLYPGSDEFGERSEDEGAVARTYRVEGVSPEQVLAFYEEQLRAQGWQPAEPVLRSDTELRSDWLKDGRRLEVTATAVGATDNSDELVVQYSLVLLPQ